MVGRDSDKTLISADTTLLTQLRAFNPGFMSSHVGLLKRPCQEAWLPGFKFMPQSTHSCGQFTKALGHPASPAHRQIAGGYGQEWWEAGALLRLSMGASLSRWPMGRSCFPLPRRFTSWSSNTSIVNYESHKLPIKYIKNKVNNYSKLTIF